MKKKKTTEEEKEKWNLAHRNYPEGIRNCTQCHLPKVLEDFNFAISAEGKLEAECRECKKKRYADNPEPQKQAASARRDINRRMLQNFVFDYLLEHPCVDCGEADLDLLDFDHVRGEKRNIISRMVNNNVSIETLRSEIDKCDIRCANCHRKRTAIAAGNWFKARISRERKQEAENELNSPSQ